MAVHTLRRDKKAMAAYAKAIAERTAKENAIKKAMVELIKQGKVKTFGFTDSERLRSELAVVDTEYGKFNACVELVAVDGKYVVKSLWY